MSEIVKTAIVEKEGGEQEMREIEELRESMGGLEQSTETADLSKVEPDKLAGLKKKAAVVVLAMAALFAATPEKAKAVNLGEIIGQGTYVYQTYKQSEYQQRALKAQVEMQRQQMELQKEQMQVQSMQQMQQLEGQKELQKQQMEEQSKMQGGQVKSQAEIMKDQQRAQFCSQVVNNPRLQGKVFENTVKACTEYFLGSQPRSEDTKKK